jgi:hypothetical protein
MGRKRQAPRDVREPLQVYLTRSERELLDRLAHETSLSRAEILRRGLLSFAAERQGNRSPMLELMRELTGDDWPEDLARAHDAHLARAARPVA